MSVRLTSNLRRTGSASLLLSAFALAACSASPSDGEPVASESGASTNVPLPSASAATQTARVDPYCTGIGPFYWEIGSGASTATSILAGGSVTDAGVPGDGGVTQTTELAIASASKFVFGAYVTEINKLLLELPENATSPVSPDLQTAFLALTHRAGYDNMNSEDCAVAAFLDPLYTAAQCFRLDGSDTPTFTDAGTINTTDFFYNGGNFQEYAVNHTLLGLMDSAGLVKEYNRVLGADLTFGFNSPDFAGGMAMSAENYAAFLRKVINKGLELSDVLDYAPVCTLPAKEDLDAGPACPTATFSPAYNLDWHYSWGHWIENDGSYSSPGRFGFYPWIDSSERYYGIIARENTNADAGAYLTSVECGEDIRQAFFTGKIYKRGVAQ